MANSEFWQTAFSSKTGKWDTDRKIVEDLSSVFKWDLDVCATYENSVCPNYFTEEQNALKQDWGDGLKWMNPPYGKEIPLWLGNALLAGGTTVCLVSGRIDTGWFHEMLPHSSFTVAVKGRLTFGSDEFWENRLQATIMKENGTKKIRAAVSKIGGALCEVDVCAKVGKFWDNLGFARSTFEQWMKKDYLRKDPAPFPSLFMVFGGLNNAQKAKLNSYGTVIKGVY